MSESVTVTTGTVRDPGRVRRVFSVWVRHYRVYMDTFIANATPAIFEPVFFLVAIGIGVGRYIDREFNGLPYAAFMAPGILGMTAMYTAAFEATYGTFVRSRYQQTYDAMRATPLTVADIFTGELLWCSTKGLLFATIVGVVLLLFGHVTSPFAVLIPVVGFFTAMAFAGLSFIITSVVKNMNHFQFYFTIGLTPVAYFSGMMFPVNELPTGLEEIACATPMFHVIETFRLVTAGPAHVSVSWVWVCPIVLVVLALALGALGVNRMRKRLLG